MIALSSLVYFINDNPDFHTGDQHLVYEGLGGVLIRCNNLFQVCNPDYILLDFDIKAAIKAKTFKRNLFAAYATYQLLCKTRRMKRSKK